jgi:hypothetical protein
MKTRMSYVGVAGLHGNRKIAANARALIENDSAGYLARASTLSSQVIPDMVPVFVGWFELRW